MREIRLDGEIRASLTIPERAAEILIVMPADEGEADGLAAWQEDRGAALLLIGGLDWNRDLSPWPAPPAFPKGEAFAGEGGRLLAALTGRLLPEAEAALPAGIPKGIAGYSLAGLFALWAAAETGVFSRAASMSGSLWFPGAENIAGKLAARRLERVYLSLGEKEERTRNPALQPVGERTRALARTLEEAGIPVTLRFHPGGHFQDVGERIRQGLDALTA